MNDEKFYFALFNSVTNAIRDLELVRLKLELAQFIAEEKYLSEKEQENETEQAKEE